MRDDRVHWGALVYVLGQGVQPCGGFAEGTGAVNSRDVSICFQEVPGQAKRLFSIEKLDKSQLSKTPTEKKLALRYTIFRV